MGLTWGHLGSLGLSWAHLDAFGFTWAHMEKGKLPATKRRQSPSLAFISQEQVRTPGNISALARHDQEMNLNYVALVFVFFVRLRTSFGIDDNWLAFVA